MERIGKKEKVLIIKKFFDEVPLRYVYVFRARQAPWMNGNPLNENGKKWSSTMCFAWFIWEGLGWFVMMGNVAETPENKGIERKIK